METIKNYVLNIFSTIPQSSKLDKLKNDILNTMEDKYNELKSEGKSENEAIGIVISEFGNINELINELDIEVTEKSSTFPTLDIDDIKDFLSIKQKVTRLISIGVVLCMIGTSMLMLVYQLIEDKIVLPTIPLRVTEIIPLIPLFILLVPAVGLFIYSGLQTEKYKYIEKGEFEVTPNAKYFLENSLSKFTPKFTIGCIVGVSICILSPLILFLGSAISESATVYCASITILIISIAVFIFIHIGIHKGDLQSLLKTGDFSPKKREDNKIIAAVASVIWPLTVCVYLVVSFVFGSWGISWIIFPVVGILFGGFSSVCSIIKGDSNK